MTTSKYNPHTRRLDYVNDPVTYSVSSPITLVGDTIGFDFTTNNVWSGTNTFSNETTLNGDTYFGTDLTIFFGENDVISIDNFLEIQGEIHHTSGEYFFSGTYFTVTAGSTFTGDIDIVGDVSLTGDLTDVNDLVMDGTFLNQGSISPSSSLNYFTVFPSVTPTASISTLYLLNFVPVLAGSQNVTNFKGGYFVVNAAAHTGTISFMTGLDVVSARTNASGSLGDLKGISITNYAVNVTNNYGLYISSVSGGSSTNYSIYTIGGDVSFGDDLIMRNDNDKIWFGTGKDSSFKYDGTNLVINPKEVGSGFLDLQGSLVATSHIKVLADSQKFYAGAGSDAAIYYDGTDLIIDPKEVGSGVLSLLGTIETQEDVIVSGAYGSDEETDDGNSSTADTIDWGNSNNHKSTLTGNVTYTFTAPPTRGLYTLKVVQGSGPYSITWPASVLFPAAVDPILSQGSGDIDIFTFYFDGTNYHCIGVSFDMG